MTDVMRKTYKEVTPELAGVIKAIKDHGEEFIRCIEDPQVKEVYPNSGREFALAKTKMEEAVFWAVKGVTK